MHVKMMQNRDRSYGAFLTSRDQNKLGTFKKFRNQLTAELKRSKSLFYNQTFSEADRLRPNNI